MKTINNSKAIILVAILLGVVLIIVPLSSVSGQIRYFSLDFERDGDFTVGIEHGNEQVNWEWTVTGHGWDGLTKSYTTYDSAWDRGGYFMSEYPTAYDYVLETNIVHSGQHSAKLQLNNPVNFQTQRLQLLHDHDPMLEQYTFESWHYIPSSYNLQPGEFLTIHQAITDRCWMPDGTYYEYNGQGIALYIDGRGDRPSYGQPIFVLMRGQAGGGYATPDSYAGLPDVYPSDARQVYNAQTWDFEWVNGEPEWMPPYNKWFGLRSYVERNVEDFINRNTANYNKGVYKVWLSTEKDASGKPIWELIYPVQTSGNADDYIPNNERTVGIYPDLLQQVGWNHGPNGEMAYVASGTMLYTSPHGQPKTVYLDDVRFHEGDPSESPFGDNYPFVGILLITGLLIAIALTNNSRKRR